MPIGYLVLKHNMQKARKPLSSYTCTERDRELDGT